MRCAVTAVPRVTVSAMVHNHWSHRGKPDDTPYKDNLSGLLLDTRTWAEQGLIDEIVAAGYYRSGGNAEKAYRAMQKETAGKVKVWLFGWIRSAAQFSADIQLAGRLGASQLLLWESDYIGLPPAKADLVKAMHDHAHK